MKLLESDFGRWLETVCDYLYYLLIFAGMAIGLIRSSETKTYIVWAGVLIFGAVTSFLVTGLGRQRLAAGRPEQYLNMTKVAFVLSAVGVNVVWLISLYSYLTFAAASRIPMRDSATSA